VETVSSEDVMTESSLDSDSDEDFDIDVEKLKEKPDYKKRR
jgi:hypothetical protein